MANWTWSLRSRDGAMNGLEFCRATTASGFTRVFVHAAPRLLSVEVVDDLGHVIIPATPLDRAGDYVPMTLLTLANDYLLRSEVWPDEEHYGLAVLLAGGEVGLLRSWHHATDHTWWKWSLEFANHQGRPADWAPPRDDEAT